MCQIILIYCLIYSLILISDIEMVAIERNEAHEFNATLQQQLLSRRRRYLTFPEGSSLQLVYDQIIGMVDTTNLHIFGITVALAWQLPHKAIFQENHTEQPMHDTRISVTDLTKKIDQLPKKSSLNTEHPHFNAYYNRSNYHPHKLNNNYLNYLQRLKHFIRPPLNKQNLHTKTESDKHRTHKPKWNYSHNIYPALKMRRQIAEVHHKDLNGTVIHPEIKQHLAHHRDTRFSLYKSIEKYLNAKGENGEECIKRAICETTQIERSDLNNRNKHEPDSFVKELLRVVFSLPSRKFHTNANLMPNHYDDVLKDIVKNTNIDCSIIYPKCSVGIWSDNFML